MRGQVIELDEIRNTPFEAVYSLLSPEKEEEEIAA
jgi:hypothetical protein